VSSSPARWTVDTNVILRYLLADSEKFTARARAFWRAVSDGHAVVEWDPVTLSEAVFVLSRTYGLPNAAISDGLLPLLRLEGVAMIGKDRYLHALELFAGSVPHFGDACACAAARRKTRARLFSFDRKLSAVPGITRSERLES
jgi:predicted nucleic acid-binding protein